MSAVSNEEEVLTNATVVAADRKYIFHSWSAQGALKPIPVARSAGSRFWDFDGKEYLDFSSQLVFTNVGHQHPKVVEAIQKQAAALTALAPQHACHARNEAAERIINLAGPDNFAKVFFTNGGADGNENAIRMCRLHTKKFKVLSFYRSYHGSTGAAITATGDPRRFPNEFAAGHVHFWGPFFYRSAFWSSSVEEECKRALEHLEQTIIFEGPNTIAAILIETVPGTAGIMPPPAGYLEGLRALCDKYKIMWIADEVMAGFGRTGKWFAFQHYNAVPDLVTFAKGVTSGYVPLGGVIINHAISKTFDETVFPGGLTYMGHPLASGCAVATLDVMQEEGIVEHAAMIGEKVLGPGLRALAQKHKIIGDVRGVGTFWCLELVTDRATKAPLAPYGASSPAMNELIAEIKANGMMPFSNFNRVHINPPCNVSEEDVRLGLEILDKSFAPFAKYYTGA